MEPLLSYLVALLLVPLTLIYLVSFLRCRSWKNLPPGTKGWPVVGENIAIALSGPEKFIKRRICKYSPDVFRTSLLGEEMAVFCGAQGNKFLFTNENKLVSTWWPESIKRTFLIPEDAERNLTEVTSLLRSFQNDILKPDALKQYVPVMDSMSRDHMDTHWVPNSVVKASPLIKKYTFELGCKIFLGVVDPEHIKKLSGSVRSGDLRYVLRAYRPTRGKRGGRLVREEMVKIIKGRRKEMLEKGEMVAAGHRNDLLSKMLRLRNGDGEFLSEIVICNNVLGLLVASFDSLSSAITTVFNYLAQLPHIYTQVLTEQVEIAKSKGPDELMRWEDIEKMKYSWNMVREAMRLTPPAQGGFREAKIEFNYAGFTIPKGWKTFWTTYSTHKNPEYFPEPEKFDPSRFEGKGPPPYTYVPFGGGPRMCPGKEYSKLGILVFLHNVVNRFRLEKTIPNEKIVFSSSPTPAHGLPVRLHPHEI